MTTYVVKTIRYTGKILKRMMKMGLRMDLVVMMMKHSAHFVVTATTEMDSGSVAMYVNGGSTENA
ncbi:hypothetical protein ACP70R_035266 [Stipagrostis hirtigluma subsp. patula]